MPEKAATSVGPGIRVKLKEVAVGEQEAAPGALAFFAATFTAVPALLLGFICGEGVLLVPCPPSRVGKIPVWKSLSKMLSALQD